MTLPCSVPQSLGLPLCQGSRTNSSGGRGALREHEDHEGSGEGKAGFTLILSPQPLVTLQCWSTALISVNHACPRKGPKLVRVQTRAGSPPSEHCSYPCPRLPQVGGDRRTHVCTRTHTHTHAHTANSISPPSALLNPISNSAKRGRAPRGLGFRPPAHHWAPPEVGRLGLSLRPPCPFLSLLVCGLLQAQLVTLGGGGRGRRQVRNSLRGPSCHLPKLGRTAGTVGPPLLP